MFGQLSERLSATFRTLRGRGKLSESDVAEVIKEIRAALLDADVALPVVRDFCERIRERAIGIEVSQSLNPGQQVVKIVHEELVQILGGEQRRLRFAKKPPTVIMLVGLQGAGKTTLAGKLAKHLAGQSHTPLLVAADLQRPNAVDQLKVVADNAKVAFFGPEAGNGVGDPVAVASQALTYAQQKLHDIVIIDTAGRLQNKKDLMDELSKIVRAVEKQTLVSEVLLVLDATMGQNAIAQAKAFTEVAQVTGVVLTKLDGSAKGGIAYAVQQQLDVPVKLVGTGEKADDFAFFSPVEFATGLVAK